MPNEGILRALAKAWSRDSGPGKRLLDLSSGAGTTTRMLASYGAFVVATDYGPAGCSGDNIQYVGGVDLNNLLPFKSATLLMVPLVFSAARGDSGLQRYTGRISLDALFNRFGLVPFNSFGVGDVVVDEQPVIIIQQFQPAPNPEPSEPATNRIYVQPRWVDGGHGVQVLQLGYWTEQAAER